MPPRLTSHDFWFNVGIKKDQNACWPWLGSLNNKGYGYTTRRGLAHVIAWKLNGGTIESGQVIMHLCNNPICCNPGHLRPGTQQENLAHAGISRLTWDKVDAIREAYAKGSVRQRELAQRFGVTQSVVSEIITGKAWRKKNA